MKSNCMLQTSAAALVLAFSTLMLCTPARADAPPANAPTAAATTTNVSGPRILFATNVFDFGTVKQGEVVKHDFVFTNIGTATLEILEVKPGCGCTTAGTWDKKVEPGKTGSIPLQFNSSGFGGRVAKSATVTCNDVVTSNLFLQLSGNVWKPIDVTPSMAMFNFNAEDQTNQTKTIRIISNLEQPLQLSDLSCNNTNFRAMLKTVKEGKEFELEITAVPPFSAQTVFGNVSIKTSATNAPTITATAYAVVQPLIYVMPQQVMLPRGPLTSNYTSQVMLRNNSSTPIKLSDPTLDIPGAEVRIQEAQPGRQFNLVLTFPSGLQLKPGEKAEVAVKSDNPKQPLIKIAIAQPQAVAATPPATPPPAKVSSTARVVPTRATPGTVTQ